MTSPRSHQEQLDIVRKRYAGIAKEESDSCCAPLESAESSCCGDDSTPRPLKLRTVARKLGYTEEQLAALPEGESLSLGCGNPLTAALLEHGMTVLDLGSGAGFDCFIAAREVGETGHVIGVDMTPEMIARARKNAAELANVEFRLGELEHLPVADGTVDVILSNCVVNLVPDKAQVFREAHRVLRARGRLAISDVVRMAEFPPEMLADEAALSACIVGAATAPEVEGWLREAGFTDIRIATNEQGAAFIKEWDPGSGAERYVQSAIIEARK